MHKQKVTHILICVCILVSVIQHDKGIVRITLSSGVLSGSTTFVQYYLINCTIFGKKLMNIKRLFWFSLQFLSEIFLILRKIQRGIIINVNRSSCKVPVILARFKINLDFLRRHSMKYSNAKFHENPSSGSRFVPCGRTYKPTDTMKLIVAFRELRKHLKFKPYYFTCNYCTKLMQANYF